MPDHNHIFSVNAVSLTDAEECSLLWGVREIKMCILPVNVETDFNGPFCCN